MLSTPLLRMAAMLSVITVGADAAAFSLSRTDVQWVFGVLLALSGTLWGFARRVGSTQKTVEDSAKAVARIEEALRQHREDLDRHTRDDAQRFAELNQKMDLNHELMKDTHASVTDSLQQMVAIGIDRRRVPRPLKK